MDSAVNALNTSLESSSPFLSSETLLSLVCINIIMILIAGAVRFCVGHLPDELQDLPEAAPDDDTQASASEPLEETDDIEIF